jgi:hypothetical protein
MKTRIARLWSDQLLFGGVALRSATSRAAPLQRNFFTTTQPAVKSNIAHNVAYGNSLLCWRQQQSNFARRVRSLRSKSDKAPNQQPNPTPHLGSPEPSPSLSQRLKKLSREYGWTAVGVYLGLSLLDFPFCFLAVRLLGTDRIGHYEDIIKDTFWTMVRLAFPDAGTKSTESSAGDDLAQATAREGNVGAAEMAAARSGADACEMLFQPMV